MAVYDKNGRTIKSAKLKPNETHNVFEWQQIFDRAINFTNWIDKYYVDAAKFHKAMVRYYEMEDIDIAEYVSACLALIGDSNFKKDLLRLVKEHFHVDLEPITSSRKPIKSSVIGISPDGIYTIEKDTNRGMYYLKTNGKIADNEHAISFNAPSVETRLERWAEIYGVELNPEYLNSSRKPLKSSVEPDYDPFTGVYFSNLEDNLYFSYAPAELEDLSGWGYGSYDEGELGGECWDELSLDEIKESCKRFEDEVRKRVTDENDVNAVLNDFYEKAAIPSGVSKGITNSRNFVKSALSAEQTRELFDKAKQMAVESLADEMGESVSEAEYRFYEELDKYEREDRTFAEYQKLLAEAEGSGPVESSCKSVKSVYDDRTGQGN